MYRPPAARGDRLYVYVAQSRGIYHNYGSTVKGVPACLRRLLEEESGQAAVFLAVGMASLLAFVGLAIDVGQLRYARLQLEAATDAAALAAALEISYCGGSSGCSVMQTAATQALAENGLPGSTVLLQCAPNSGADLTLAINSGPCAMGSTTNDPNFGNMNYVEAVVTKVQPTYFIRVIGIPSIKIAARAEAVMGNSPFCLDTLGTSGTTFQSNGGILTASCGILVNSSGASAFASNGGSITASTISVHGGTRINSTSMSPQPITNAPALPDPLSWVPTPPPGGCAYTSTYVINSGSATLYPGTYCGGILINGGSAYFSPGVYTLKGSGLQVNGGSITGDGGVTFYLAGGSAMFAGSSSIDLVAPTTGTYAGILFFQDPSDTSTATINGGPGTVFQGALYFPGAAMQLNGANVAAYTIVDSKSVQMNGGSFQLGNNYSSLPGGSPAKNVTALLAQ